MSPITRRVEAINHPDRVEQSAAAFHLLRQIGMTGRDQGREFTYELTFAGQEPVRATAPYSGDPSWFPQMFAPGASARCVTVFTWDAPVLTVTVTLDQKVVGTVVAEQLGPGQSALARRLLRYHHGGEGGGEPAADLAREYPDQVAAVVALVPHTRDEDADSSEDPTGLLGFADAVTRAGVDTWDQTRISALAALAAGWAGTPEQLLDTLEATLAVA